MTVKELYAAIGGDYDMVKRLLMMDKMIERTIVKLPLEKNCDLMTEAWEAGDGKLVFEKAHALKGVLANLGIKDLAARAGEICDEFRQGKARSMSDEELEGKIRSFQADFGKICGIIRDFEKEKGA